MASQDLANTLLTKVAEEGHHGSAKVTVVGTGQVGMAAAFAMMTQVRLLLTHPTHGPRAGQPSRRTGKHGHYIE